VSVAGFVPGRAHRALAVGSGLLIVPWVTLTAVSGLAAGAGAGIARQVPEPSARALADIPPPFLALYRVAAQRYGLDWAVLAGIGKVECDHGRDPDPSCSQEGAVNGAGAGGPMQFLASTWSHYGVDGNGDGRRDRWDAADAIYSAANYLRASGAPASYQRAVFAYNHDGVYVAAVLRWAARYRAAAAVQPEEAVPSAALQAGTPTAISYVAGGRARLAPGDGHLALIPTEAPFVVQAMIVAGNELQGLRYGPGGHPDPRGTSEEDCSSTVSYVLYRAGVRQIGEIVRENPLAQDYVHWGLAGPGRWVTIYATDVPSPHVFIVIAGLRLDTSHNGTDFGPNRDQDGPRWRISDTIPTWAHWSVRHPPGL